MVGWHLRLNGHEFEQTVGDSEGQGSLVCCSSGSHKEPDPTWPLNSRKLRTAIHRENMVLKHFLAHPLRF